MTIVQTSRAWYARLTPEWQVRLALVYGLGGANAVGVVVVLMMIFVILPLPPVAGMPDVQQANLILTVAVVAVAGSLGVTHAWRVLHPVVTLLRRDAPLDADPTDVQRDVLSAPRRIFIAQAFLWAAASVAFLAQNLRHDTLFGIALFLVVGLAGWSTSCLVYLLAERALRPVARVMLAAGVPDRRFVRSVAARSMFAWALGTGVTVIGSLALGIAVLADPDQVTTEQVAVTVIALATITLLVGGLSSYTAAQASSEPIGALREALAKVEQGDYDVSVPIYDGTEIGLLQAGFNQMAAGLTEREQLRDLFGRHVGEDVARRALDSGIRLGGEVRDVTVLFVDIAGSTTLAEDAAPERVVELLNRFFAVVIDVVHEYDGFINKFAGDAALAIWGAPTDRPDRCTAALSAARTIAVRLRSAVPELAVGIGVSGGPVVAGNVGASERFEYTVIGDPVNEAARLTDLAKTVRGTVLANHALVEGANAEESRHWQELPAMMLRGRSQATRVAGLR